MSEVNENVQNETQENGNIMNTSEQIEIQEKGGTVKKIIKVVVTFLVGGVFGAVVDHFFGGKSDENDSAEAEAPQDE